MDRRGFLSSLLKGAAALGYVATVGLPSLAEATPVQVEQAIKATLQWLTQEIASMVSARLGPLELVDSGFVTYMTPHHFSVSLELPTKHLTPTAYRDSYVEPIVASLAESLRYEGVTKCGVLPVPDHGFVGESCVVTHKERGMSLRGLEYFDVYQNLMQIRFDILAG